jgi:uncharacterized membrane protein
MDEVTSVRASAVPARAQSSSPRPIVLTLVRERSWQLVVWTAMLVWSIALCMMVRSDYLSFRLARFDLGNIVQAVWSTAHGHPLETTDANGEQIVRLASHVDPILVLFAPLWILAPSPVTLASAQIVTVALGALPVFWLARRHLGSERAAALLVVVYLAYPWLAWTALDAVHPVTFAIPLFLYAIWLLDTGKLGWFGIVAALVLSTGELMGLPLALLGVWYGLARGGRQAGIVIAGVGVAWTMLCLEVVIRTFNGGKSSFYERYDSVGGSPVGILKTTFTDPGSIVSALTSSG